MAKLMEVRIRFSDKEKELFDYIRSKRNAAGFLKDLAETERRREFYYVNPVNEIVKEVINQLDIKSNFTFKALALEEKAIDDNAYPVKKIDTQNDFCEVIDDNFDD